MTTKTSSQSNRKPFADSDPAHLRSFALDILPTPFTDSGKALKKLAQERDIYLAKRDSLRDLSHKQSRLRRTASALREESLAAREKWRDLFRKNDGVATTEIRKLQEEERIHRDEAEQVDDMVRELEPAKERERIETYLSRIGWRTARNQANRQRIVETVRGVEASAESGGELAGLLPDLIHFARNEVIGDAAFMVVRGYFVDGTRTYKESLAAMPPETLREIREEANKRALAWIGAAIVNNLNHVSDQPLPDVLLPIAAESHEAADGEYGSAHLGVVRALAALKTEAE